MLRSGSTKKVIPPTGDQTGKDTQAPQPQMGRFVEGERAYKISQPRMKAMKETMHDTQGIAELEE